MKKKIYYIINENPIFIKFIYTLIILNILCLFLQSYKSINNSFKDFFYYFEVFSVIIFSIEYILRLWSSNLKKTKNSRLKFVFSTLGLIDLLAVLPFYLPFIFPFDLRIIRILRIFRLLRIFKLGRFSKSLKLINSVLKESKSELLITLFVATILLILSSTLMYYVENEVQPENFASIGHSFWWAVATLTTVGYGDVYPITALGKFLSGIIAIIGIGFVALPTGIISSAFVERINNREKCCPNCGKSLD